MAHSRCRLALLVLGVVLPLATLFDAAGAAAYPGAAGASCPAHDPDCWAARLGAQAGELDCTKGCRCATFTKASAKLETATHAALVTASERACQGQLRKARKVARRLERSLAKARQKRCVEPPILTESLEAASRSVGAGLEAMLEAGSCAARLDVEPDPTRMASALVGPEGGSLEAVGADGTRYRLEIPPLALLEDTALTLTPAVAPHVSFDGGVVAAVQLEPSGLALWVPGTLTVDLPSAVDAQSIAGFGWDGGGWNLHLELVEATPTELVFRVHHFSGLGAGLAAPADLAALRQLPVSGATNQHINHLIAGCADPAAVDDALRNWFDQVVRPSLQAAQSDPALADALRDYDAWSYAADAAYLTCGLPGSPQLGTRVAEARSLAASALLGGIQRADTRCRALAALEGAEDVLRWQAIAEALGVVGVVSGLDLTTVLEGLCVEIRYEDTSYAQTPQAGVTSPLSLDVRIAFASGGTTLTQPIGVEVDAQGTVEASASDNTDAAGLFTAPFTPVGGQEVSLVADACVDDAALPKVSQHVCQTAIIVRGIEVTPPAAQVQVGATQQFAALLAGAPYANVTWSTTGGSIDPSGLYTAGSPGSYTVTVTDNANSGSQASASVTVGSALGCTLSGAARSLHASAIIRDNRGFELLDGKTGDVGTTTAQSHSDTPLHELDASSSAAFGSVSAGTGAQARIAGSILDPYNVDGVASARWVDTVLFQPTTGAARQTGRVRARIQIQATGAVSGGVGAFVNGEIRANLGPRRDEFDFSQSRSGGFDEAGAEEVVFEPIELGVPTELRLEVLVSAANLNTAGDAEIDVSASWLGITGVEDANGVPVPYTLCSGSGVDWRQAQ
jgi:hypothetical protein